MWKILTSLDLYEKEYFGIKYKDRSGSAVSCYFLFSNNWLKITSCLVLKNSIYFINFTLNYRSNIYNLGLKFSLEYLSTTPSLIKVTQQCFNTLKIKVLVFMIFSTNEMTNLSISWLQIFTLVRV